jgi:hypothetical protein
VTDAEVKEFLKESGYPEHIVKGGRKGLIEQWEKFVREVEHGYSLNLEDYRNDLDVRAIIANVGLQSDVEEADKRLRRLLVFTEESVWDCDDNPDAFWLFGYPKNAKGDLLDDLRGEGFVE